LGRFQYQGGFMIVNIPKELDNLDRNDFTKVCEFVDKIVEDIEEILTEIGDEEALALTKDYMIDLINPDLLDFDKEET
jgi:hypothetical protein